MRSPVRENQNRDSPVRTRPLSGIAVGRTTSNALRRSDATSSRRSSETAYRSRTLPERRKVSASGIELGLQAVETGNDGGDMAKDGGVVEAGVEPGEADPPGDLGVDGEQVAERGPLVGGAERGTLDDGVGRLATHPAALDEEPQDPAARVQPQPPLDVLEHPLRPDDEAVDQLRGPDQHVVEEDRRVRKDHPLRAAVGDVALVPERLVLHRGDGVATEEPGEAGD